MIEYIKNTLNFAEINSRLISLTMLTEKSLVSIYRNIKNRDFFSVIK